MVIRRRWLKSIVLLTTGASVLGIGSCLGVDLSKALRIGAFYVASEYVLDNNNGPLGNLDIFADS